jgi:hypothetical protein
VIGVRCASRRPAMLEYLLATKILIYVVKNRPASVRERFT